MAESEAESDAGESPMRIRRVDIERLVREPYLSRGEVYFNQGLVKIISVSDSEIKSKTVGKEIYEVTLRHNGISLGGECSCPAFRNWGPCKHMAATGFALIASNQWGYEASAFCHDRIDEQNRVERLLLTKTREELIKIILNHRGLVYDLYEEYGLIEEEDL